MNKLSKVVFTDIDGTLLKGFITINFVEYLYKKNIFNKVQYSKQMKLMALFKDGKISFLGWLKKWASIWGEGIKGKKKKSIQYHANKFFPTFLSNIYPSSKELINYFHEKGYVVVGVSVGVEEVDLLVKKYLGLDYLLSSSVSTKGGVYTSKVKTRLHLKNGKKLAVLSLFNKDKVNFSACIGIGDSEFDEQFIDLMGKKIALNPNKKFLESIFKKNYLISNYGSILTDIKKII